VVLHKCIDIVLFEPKSLPNVGAVLTLKCKNFSVLYIDCSASIDDCLQITKSLEVLSNLANVKLHYPFFYQCNFRICEDGWNSFNLDENEFIRLLSQSDFWRVSDVNRNFAVCSSYPEQVVVPKSVSDDILKSSALFREGGRFPAVIVRCSQPFAGNGNRRCKEDETLLNAMLNSSNKGYIIDTRSQAFAQAAKVKDPDPNPADDNAGQRFIHGCRHKVTKNMIFPSFCRALLLCKLSAPPVVHFVDLHVDFPIATLPATECPTSYGYEPEMHYPRWKRIHRATPRFAQLQESLVKLIDAALKLYFLGHNPCVFLLFDRVELSRSFLRRSERYACNDNDISPEKWISKLNSSSWLQNISDLLNCACIAAQCADREGQFEEYFKSCM
uniref:Myotubularin phosphatase domain-containing protein n=1 Tax=Romanomermis culicivorax TaxID=13658 RepID=A0A915JIU4_ROMCU